MTMVSAISSGQLDSQWKSHPLDAHAVASDLCSSQALCILKHLANMDQLELTSTDPNVGVQLLAHLKVGSGSIYLMQPQGPLRWSGQTDRYSGIEIQDPDTAVAEDHPPSTSGHDGLVSIHQPGEKFSVSAPAFTNLMYVQLEHPDREELMDQAQSTLEINDFLIELTVRFLGHVRFSASFVNTQDLANQYITAITGAVYKDRLQFPIPALERIDRRVIRAVEHLSDAETRCFDISATAKAALTSERNLYNLMREEIGLTPYHYYLRTRLIAVRKALLSDRRMKPNISWHAASMGFSHLGRFSAQYKQLFGELPSTTLVWQWKYRSLCGSGG